MGPDKRSEGVISPSSLNPGGPPSGFHASGASTPRREVFALRKLPGTGAAPIGRREAVIGARNDAKKHPTAPVPLNPIFPWQRFPFLPLS